MKFYLEETQRVFDETASAPEGLSGAEAKERLLKNGPNKLKEGRKISPIKRFLNQLTDPMIIILLAATSLSPSLIYPANGVGSLALTCIASRIIFKEELSTRQWIGIAVGAVAIALLSL